jgi:hypothetical protein
MCAFVQLLTATSCLLYCASLANVAMGMGANELLAMSTEDQRILLEGILKNRLETFHNIEIASRTCSGIFEFDDGVIGDQVKDNGCGRSSFKRLRDGYRLDTKLFTEAAAREPVIDSQTNFDPAKGESRNLTKTAPVNRLFGRIDAKRDDTIELNRAAHYLAEAPDANQGLFLSPFLKVVDKWRIEVFANRDEVLISCPFEDDKLPSQLNVNGSRMLALNIAQGFTPVRSTIEWRTEGSAIWRKEVVEFKNLTETGDHWIPAAINEQILASSLDGDVCLIRETTVEKASLGTVSPSDLEITFPKGTHVVDVVRGVSFVAGEKGAPDGAPMPLLKYVEMEESGSESRGGIILWSNIAIVAVICLALIYRKFMNK